MENFYRVTIHLRQKMLFSGSKRVIREALVKGYLDSAGAFLNKTENEYLAFSGKLITFEIGLHFLTDYLSGDVYFKAYREEHDLDLTRNQFKMVQDMEDLEDRMRSFVKEHST